MPLIDRAAAILPTRAPSLCVQIFTSHSTAWKRLAERSKESQANTTSSLGLGAS